MKRTLIALTALAATTFGLQSQALAGHKLKPQSGLQIEFSIGDKASVRYAHGPRRYRQQRRYREFQKRNYLRRDFRQRGCYVADRRSIKRSLRQRGFYDINRLRRQGRFFSAKAISPRGHLVKVKVNGCNYRIVKRKILRPYPPVRYYGGSWGANW